MFSKCCLVTIDLFYSVKKENDKEVKRQAGAWEVEENHYTWELSNLVWMRGSTIQFSFCCNL